VRKFAAIVVVGAVLMGVAAPAQATLHPQRGMAGIVLGMTKAQVRASLGPPTVGGVRWYYPRVWVGFRARRAVEIGTSRRTERTTRGAGVGSTEAQVLESLPRAVCGPYPPRFRRCRVGTGRPGTRVTDFLLGGRLVLEVTITLLPG
jgi:hypothetical protein